MVWYGIVLGTVCGGLRGRQTDRQTHRHTDTQTLYILLERTAGRMAGSCVE